MRRFGWVVIVAVALVVGCSPRGVEITAAEYGERWPFSVASGRLRCERPMMVVFSADGTDYAVNGMAASRYADIDPIWLDYPAIPGTKISIGPIISAGLDMCQS